MSYIASSIELPAWIGTLPEDWTGDWLKWSVSLKTERVTAEEQERLPYLSNENIESWTGRLLGDALEPAEADSRRFVAGDVLFNKLRPYLAKVFHAEFEGASSGELLCLRSSNRVLPRYLFYVLTSWGFIDAVDAETFGSKMPRADWETVGHQPLPLPLLDTQRRIARFLDEKTARIDALIAKKRALLERLAEKRQALITQAVTKGLDPAARMKDSGTEWLGKIPAHWEVKRLRFVVRLASGGTPTTTSSEYWDGEIPWISPKDMKSDVVRDSLEKITPLAVEECGLKLFSECSVVLVVRGMILARRIPVAVASGAYTINQDMKVLQSKGLVSPHILQMYLASIESYLMTLVAEAGHGTKALRTDVLLDTPVLIAPPSEQKKIVEVLEKSVTCFDSVLVKLKAELKLLSEYRAALITAAVTDQLDMASSVHRKEAAHA